MSGAANRYFEDYPVAAVFTAGPLEVTETEIVEFARRYDPQPMHTDPEAARRGRFGGLIASGWHTGAMMMRLFADHVLSPVSSMASPGLDELRWLHPVRPGDSLTLRVTVLEARLSRSKPEQGIVRSLVELINQRGETVLSLKPVSLIRRRPE
jgi:acyl dehydratase